MALVNNVIRHFCLDTVYVSSIIHEISWMFGGACCEAYAQDIEDNVLTGNELSEAIQQLLRDTIALYRLV